MYSHYVRLLVNKENKDILYCIVVASNDIASSSPTGNT